MPHSFQSLILSAPPDGVSFGHLDARSECRGHSLLISLHILRSRVDVDVSGQQSVLVADHRWTFARVDGGQLAETRLPPAWSGHQHFFQRIDIGPEIAHVADVHRIARPPIDYFRDRLPADRVPHGGLSLFHADSLTSQSIAVPIDIQIIAITGPFREDGSRRGVFLQYGLNFFAEFLNPLRVRAGDLETQRAAHSRGEHVDTAAHRHG